MHPRKQRRQAQTKPKRRWLLPSLAFLFAIVVTVPVLASPASAEVLDVLVAALEAIRYAAQDAYCALGVSAFCP